ncbi:hypothetical protein VIGAN_07227000 [Vigna angularis var. angularis]|uniref:Uncharacterized protein n=1 Tax=Vigna angularis var. angularis TaxID=157739 RepID=A0A0S3SKF9_PHAAN|nr:hypothetical protein VIGAN_07227000 [Vigna angularis var. angularis]
MYLLQKFLSLLNPQHVQFLSLSIRDRCKSNSNKYPCCIKFPITENPEPGRNCLNCETLYSIHCLNKIIPRQRRQHRFSGEEESQLQQPRSCDATNVNTKVEPQRGDSLRRRKSKLQVPTPNNLCYGTVAGFMDGEGQKHHHRPEDHAVPGRRGTRGF